MVNKESIGRIESSKYSGFSLAELWQSAIELRPGKVKVFHPLLVETQSSSFCRHPSAHRVVRAQELPLLASQLHLCETSLQRLTSFYCPLLHSTLGMPFLKFIFFNFFIYLKIFLIYLKNFLIENLWQSCIKRVYWYHFSNRICLYVCVTFLLILTIFQFFLLLLYLLW